MGLDVHAVNLLKYAVSRQPLGDVATMGRQGLGVPIEELQQLLGPQAVGGDWCEPLLTETFGAASVESFDYSDFEGATHIVDLNKPHEPERQYDTILDAGTLEHIFNAPQALKTMAKLCKPGGQILHILPSNNFCNHGFWQISPELFISLYNEKNGFADTDVFLADFSEFDHWWKVTPPQRGHWSDATTPRSISCLAITRKVRDVEEFEVQQAGYAASWDAEPWQPEPKQFSGLKGLLQNTPLFPMARFARRITKPADWAFRRNPDFQRVSVPCGPSSLTG